jgi:ABC-type metal ion transport system substrate-binding protein
MENHYYFSSKTITILCSIHIKVGVINGAEQDVAEVAKKVAKEKYGLDVELVGDFYVFGIVILLVTAR